MEAPAEPVDEFGCAQLPEGARVRLSASNDLVPDGFPEPILQIDIFVNLPWVSVERPD